MLYIEVSSELYLFSLESAESLSDDDYLSSKIVSHIINFH